MENDASLAALKAELSSLKDEYDQAVISHDIEEKGLKVKYQRMVDYCAELQVELELTRDLLEGQKLNQIDTVADCNFELNKLRAERDHLFLELTDLQLHCIRQEAGLPGCDIPNNGERS